MIVLERLPEMIAMLCRSISLVVGSVEQAVNDITGLRPPLPNHAA